MDSRLRQIEDGFERELGALLGSVNFSGYSDRARLRADDLAVRTYASREILKAKMAIASRISDWCGANVPEPTREAPFPADAISQKLRTLRSFETHLAELEHTVRAAEAPDLDAVWNLRTDGTAVLSALLNIDRTLVKTAQGLANAAETLTLADFDKPDPFESLRQSENDLRSILAQRRNHLRNRAI